MLSILTSLMVLLFSKDLNIPEKEGFLTLHQNLDLSKFKALADDKINVTQNLNFLG